MTKEIISENYPEVLLCDGFDDAIIGIAERAGMESVVAYNVEKILDILMIRDKMTYDEALEYYEFNIVGAWMGEFTSVFIKM